MQLVVDPAGSQQLLVGSALDDAAGLDDVDAVRQAGDQREVVPIELLETVNRLFTQMESGSLDPFVERSPHEIYETVSGLCRAITGAVEEAMPRGDGYRFLVMGRMLERAEMTCRMIDVNRTVSGTDTSAWMVPDPVSQPLEPLQLSLRMQTW